MKKNSTKYILFLLLITLCGLEIQCQVEPGAIGTKWTFGRHHYTDDSYDYNGTIPDEYCTEFSFTIEKDTIVNDTVLKKVVDGEGNFELLSFDNDKISFYKRDSLFTFMDANGQIGDTIIITKDYEPPFFENGYTSDTIQSDYLSHSSWGYIIDDIDSIEFSGSKYLRQKVKPISNFIDNGIRELIYPFGSVYSSVHQTALHKTSMFGGGDVAFFNYFYYDYSKSIESNGEIIELYTDTNDCPTSIDVVTANEVGISIFPNPTPNELFISDHFNQIEKITLFDLSSKEVKHLHPTNNLINIELSNFSDGIYLLRLKLKSGKIVSEHIYKQ